MVSLEIRRRDSERTRRMAIQDLTDTELSRLFIDTGIDLSTLPAIATAP